ncbi:hypothetical protein R84B8_00155 [Treponema sp. R8-4-B8]
MTEKQRFLVYVHFAGLLSSIRKNNKLSISEAVKIMLSNGIINKLEDLETGYYLESDAYLENALIKQNL